MSKVSSRGDPWRPVVFVWLNSGSRLHGEQSCSPAGPHTICWLPSRMAAVSHTAGTFQSQDLNSNWYQSILDPAFPQELAVWPWSWVLTCTGYIQQARLFYFLQFFSVLWAAVVGKCQVINNSYTNAEAAEREMSLGNGISKKSTNFIIQPFLITIFPYFGFMVNWLSFIHVRETYLCLNVWPRDIRDIKMKLF